MSRKIFTLLFCIVYGILALAEEPKVTLRENRMDLSASTNIVKDANSIPCALLRINLIGTNASFSGNIIGDVTYKNNEYLVYMTNGSKRLRVTHPDFAPLMIDFSKLGIESLKSKVTYELTISYKHHNTNNSSEFEEKYNVCPEPSNKEYLSAKRLFQEKQYDEALSILMKIHDNPYAQYYIGMIYDLKGKIDKNYYKDAAEWYEKAANGDVTDAQYDIALYYKTGKGGLHEDKDKAAYWFREAALRNDCYAQFELAKLYDEENATEQDKENAIYWYKRSLEGDDPDFDASWRLGLLYLDVDGLKKDYEEAERLFQLAIDEGYNEGYWGLGLMAEKGLGQQRNLEKAIELYEKAGTEQNSSIRLAQLAYDDYYNMPDIKKYEIFSKYYDYPYYNPKAMYGLGLLYINGIGTEKNMEKAVMCLEKASSYDNIDAMAILGAIYLEPSMKFNKENEGIILLKRAAEKGSIRALRNLAVCYREGIGVPIDLYEADKYEKLANAHSEEE